MSSAARIDDETDALETDPIWATSRTARQIFALGQVEKVVLRRVLCV